MFIPSMKWGESQSISTFLSSYSVTAAMKYIGGNILAFKNCSQA
jgi:hypothetical protein